MTQPSGGGEIVEDRQAVYGDAVLNYTRVAQIWSGILAAEVTATDAALCMIGVKLVRAQEMPDYSDNSDDIEGYLDIFRQVVGSNMISARSVADYVEQKRVRAAPPNPEAYCEPAQDWHAANIDCEHCAVVYKAVDDLETEQHIRGAE